MGVRGEARRQKIVEAAVEVFREQGFERASMAEIASRAGGSKATLYWYFPTKGDLFSASMLETVDEQGIKALNLLDPADPDVGEVLRKFGAAALRTWTSNDALALTRAGVAEGANHVVIGQIYELSGRRAIAAIERYLSALIERGVLRPLDTRVACEHLQALLQAGVLFPLLFGAKPPFKRKDAIRNAIDVFLRAYAVEPNRWADISGKSGED
jgi:AcrR family transcriptional regulator